MNRRVSSRHNKGVPPVRYEESMDAGFPPISSQHPSAIPSGAPVEERSWWDEVQEEENAVRVMESVGPTLPLQQPQIGADDDGAARDAEPHDRSPMSLEQPPPSGQTFAMGRADGLPPTEQNWESPCLQSVNSGAYSGASEAGAAEHAPSAGSGTHESHSTLASLYQNELLALEAEYRERQQQLAEEFRARQRQPDDTFRTAVDNGSRPSQASSSDFAGFDSPTTQQQHSQHAANSDAATVVQAGVIPPAVQAETVYSPARKTQQTGQFANPQQPVQPCFPVHAPSVPPMQLLPPMIAQPPQPFTPGIPVATQMRMYSQVYSAPQARMTQTRIVTQPDAMMQRQTAQTSAPTSNPSGYVPAMGVYAHHSVNYTSMAPVGVRAAPPVTSAYTMRPIIAQPSLTGARQSIYYYAEPQQQYIPPMPPQFQPAQTGPQRVQAYDNSHNPQMAQRFRDPQMLEASRAPQMTNGYQPVYAHEAARLPPPASNLMSAAPPTARQSQRVQQSSDPAPQNPASSYYVNTYRAANERQAERDQATGGGTHGASEDWSRPNGQIPHSSSGPSQQPISNQQAHQPQPHRARPTYRRVLQDLPTFGGAPEDWPHFICAFEETTREFELTDLDNMGRLLKALVGDARSRVKGILVRPEHVRRAVETLARAFGRPGMLLESQLEQISKMPKIVRLKDLVSFSIAVDAMVSFLDGPATQHILTNYSVLKELEAKLPSADQRKWASAARRMGDQVSVRDFAIWLADEADDVENMKNLDAPTKRDQKTPSTGRRHVLMVATQTSIAESCGYCKEAHDIEKCATFNKMTPLQRFSEIRRRPLCYACLKPGHLLPSCQTARACGVDGCERRHHRLLHGETNQTQGASQSRSGGHRKSSARHSEKRESRSRSAKQPSKDEESSEAASADEATPKEAVMSCRSEHIKRKVYYRVVPVLLHGPKACIQTHALFDEGSSVSLIDADVADQLELDGVEKPLDLQFVRGVSSIQVSRKVAFGISAIGDGAQRFEIGSVQTSKGLSLPMQTLEREEIIRHNPHLIDVPFAEFHDVRPTILLGLEHFHLGVAEETRIGPHPQTLTAARTKLGWILYGCGGKRAALPEAVVMHARRVDEENDSDVDNMEALHELVRQHFTTENFGAKLPTAPIRSDADERALATMEETTKRIGARFETGLLWRRDDITLPASREMAINRLRSVESKMRRDENYAQQYREQIRSYVAKGYARKLSPEEAARTGPRTWYLPHFAVQHACKPGKFRLVFDAAAAVKGTSLNDALLAGPDLNVPLARLLFRMRLGLVAVGADIREMFHQVLVREADQDSQRFVWRDGDSSAEAADYVMVAMTFGATCSPTLAQFVKNRNAQDHAAQYPEAVKAIQQQHYVDDFVASFRTVEEAARVTAEVIAVHARGGFDLRGVVSNSPEVQRQFASNENSSSTIRLEPKDPIQKILGMVWQTDGDFFTFCTRFHRVNASVLDGSRPPTKREMLSFVMSIFDPFGLLSDFMLPSKSMLQELWRLGIEWDEPIPKQIDDRWQEWRAAVSETRKLRVSRCYSPRFLDTPDLQLHIFADASEEAFAAVAYWRIGYEGGTDLAFVAGKSRCSPLKLLSIPRLELQAAVLATRLMKEIRTTHEDQQISRIVFWTDSETVLKWLRCDRRRYAPFVAHRVAEIVDDAPANQWRWVPTALNVADDATRIRRPILFDPESRWLLGPSWLRGADDTWPQQPTHLDSTEATEEELRPKFVGVITSQQKTVDFSRFSKWTRLIRCIGWTRRFGDRTRGRGEIGELTAAEVRKAAETVCRLIQMEVYKNERDELSCGRALGSKSKLFVLAPYLDEEGVLRLHGRTDAAKPEFISSSAKRPIIMPDDHHVTKLIVRHHHELKAHQLTHATMASVRSQFWVPKLRPLVKCVQRECRTCILRAAAPNPPTQGQLPPDRLNAYSRPFTNTGVDLFGPLYVTVGRRQEKRWAALFTCMAIRAVHIEIVANLSTDAFLLALNSFCSTRGRPAMIRCDNGTNFVGAKNKLAKEGVDAVTVQRSLCVQEIEWRFNCPHNPEAGGAWERLVQAVKKVLKATLHESAPQVETLRAMLTHAADTVNSRPLTHVQVTPEDPEPITPNHFLLGGPNVVNVPNPSEVEPKSTREQWRICQGLSRRFWAQFVEEYMPELTRRGKHYPEQPPLQVDDLVLVCDPQQPRTKWIRGIVIETVTGNDGVIRTAIIKTATGECRRPLTRLARLDVGPPNGDGVRGAVSAKSPEKSNTAVLD